MNSNVSIEVGLVTIFLQHCIQRNEICFKPGNKHETKSYAKQVASQAQVESVPTAEAGSFRKPG